MKKSRVFMLLAAAVAAPSAAQPPAQEPEQAPIVVEGRRDRDRQIRDLLKALPPVGAAGHLAKFEEPTCPAVLGLPGEQKALIVRRMRTLAAGIGVPVGKPDCAPNVLVIVTPDKSRLLHEMWKRFPDFLGEVSRWDVGRLGKDPNPTALWHMMGSIGSDGRPPSGSSIEGVAVNRTTAHASRIQDFAHPALTGSILVIEDKALVGLTTTEVADYALMRTFTGVDPAHIPAGSPQTILKLLDTPMGGEAPVTLTRWDLAFLRSFYGTNGSLYAPAQRGQIAAGMAKELDRDPNAPRRR